MKINFSKFVSLVESEQYTSSILKPFLRIKGEIGVEELIDIQTLYGEDAMYWLAGKTLIAQSTLIAKRGGKLSDVPRDDDGHAAEYVELVGNLYEQIEKIRITFEE